MKHVKFLVAALAVAVVMALFEIQVEGSAGWAANLPTWRRQVFVPFMGMWGGQEKPLTGYHFYLWLYSFALVHGAFLLTKWSLKKELYVLSFYITFTTLEGLLWFMLNPAFGWHRFRYGEITWYKEFWILGLPAEYWLRLGFSGMVYWWANALKENTTR